MSEAKCADGMPVRTADLPSWGWLCDGLYATVIISKKSSPIERHWMKATIYPIQAANPLRIAIVARPRGGDWLCDEIAALLREEVDLLISMLTPEEAQELGLNREPDECGAATISFINIPVPDRSVPYDKDEFLRSVDRIAEQVRQGRSIAVHCRAGIGRSSMLAVSVLVRLGWDVNEAFQAVESARGRPVPDTSEQRKWVVENVPSVDARA
jgi:protein-tyrosine phosphatase